MQKSKQAFISVVLVLFFITGLLAFPAGLLADISGKPSLSCSTLNDLPESLTVAPAGGAGKCLILDDGSRDNDIGLGGTIEMIWVNRFTPNPSEFPLTINNVEVLFSSIGLVNVGDDIIIVVYENTSGNTDPAVGSNLLYQYPTTVQAIDAWSNYTLPTPVQMNGPGDVIVGVIALETPGYSYWPASMDQTATQGRSWAGWWNSSPTPNPPTLPPPNWTLIDSYYPGNWMIHACYTSGPDQFIFDDETDVKRGVMIYSNKITVSGISVTVPISITGGSYSINGGPYKKTKGKVNSGDTVTVQLQSSRSYCTTKKATLTIGGVSDTFSVTTRGPYGKPCDTPGIN